MDRANRPQRAVADAVNSRSIPVSASSDVPFGAVDDLAHWATGRLLSTAESRRLLIGAFVRDILDTIPHASLRDDLARRVAFA